MIRGIIGVWNGILESIAALLALHPADWADGAPWQMAADIHRDVMGVAVGLMVLFWAASFFRYIDDLHKIDAREMFVWVLRFAVIYAVLEFSMDIMELILGVAVETNEKILGYSVRAVPEVVPEDILEAVEEINTGGFGALLQQIGAFFEMLPLSILFLLMLIVVVICGVILIVTIYVRFFKMYIYTAVAPLPLSTLTGKQLSQTGIHFLKSWAGVCLEICVISIALAVFNSAFSADTALFTFADTSGMDANATLWNGSVNWMTNLLIRIVLLVSVVRGADRLIGKMFGV